MRLWLGPFLLACAASAFAADAAPSGEASSMTLGGELQQAATVVSRQPLAFSVRRHAGSGSKQRAYERLEGALQDLAKEQGLQTTGRTDSALTIEVDSTFYVYTNRFNARLIRLPEYTQAQLDGARQPIRSAPSRSPTWCGSPQEPWESFAAGSRQRSAAT